MIEWKLNPEDKKEMIVEHPLGRAVFKSRDGEFYLFVNVSFVDKIKCVKVDSLAVATGLVEEYLHLKRYELKKFLCKGSN